MKKFLAVALTLALTLALFAFPLPANAAVTTGNTTNVLFEDDFESYVDYTTNANVKSAMIDNGWQDPGNNTKAGYGSKGSYVVPEGVEGYMVTSTENTANWSEYTVSVDANFVSVPETRTITTYALVTVNAPALNAGGYDFGLCLNTDGSKELIIRRRKYEEEYGSISRCASKDYTFDTANGTVYNIKATYKGGIIYGYINGDLELTYSTLDDDVMITKGSAGFRKNGKDCSVQFDNFKVEKTERTVWYEENFIYDSVEDVTATGWLTESEATNIVENGALAIDFDSAHNYLINTSGTEAWNDYSVEADFEITRNSGTASTGYFGLSGRMYNGCGYEFTMMIGSTSTNNISARIRKLESSNTKLIEGTSCKNFVSGEIYKLKLEFIGSTINGYINNELVCSYEDSYFSRGTAGINVAKKDSCSVDVTVDNIKVTGYKTVKEYINEDFDNVTEISTLLEQGYAANNLGDNNLKNSALCLDSTRSGTYSLYNLGFKSNDYTTEVEAKVVGYSDSSYFGITAGETSTSHKTGIYFAVTASSTGKINKVTLVDVGAGETISSLKDTDYAKTVTSQALETTVYLKLSIVPGVDEDNNVITKVTATISNASATLATIEREIAREIKGYSALYGNASILPQYDNFKAYPNVISSYEPEKIGELDGDGIVTSADGRYIREYLLGANDATVADLNNDTYSDIRDLVHFTKVFEFYK